MGSRRIDRVWRFLLPICWLGVAATLPPLLLDGVWNFTLALALIYGLMGLSMVVLTGYVGQLSLMPATFVGVGAFTAANLATRLDTPFWGAVPLAALLTVPVAVVIGMVALRLKGLYLAIMTLVFADVVQEFLFRQSWFVGEGAIDASRPKLWGVDFANDKAYYEIVLFVSAVMLVLVWNFSKSRSARACYAVRDNEPGAQALGINVAKYKLLAFALHGFIAGLAGALLAFWTGNVSAGGQRPQFGLEISLTIVFLAIVGGVRSIWGPFLGSMVWVILTWRLLSDSANGKSITLAIFGILVLLTLLYKPAGMISFFGEGADRLRARLPKRGARKEPAEVKA